MKKVFLVMIALLVLAFAACGETEKKHTHAPADGWERDGNEHWQICECGEKLNVSAHTLDDADHCEICNSDVWDLGDGMIDVNTYNAHGDIIKSTSYEAGGKISYEAYYEIEYDENGNMTSNKQYENGVLSSESLYTLGSDGAYEKQYTGYREDGSRDVNEYDENGNMIAFFSYDPDGTKTFEGKSEYSISSDGSTYESKATEYDYLNGKIYISEYNEYEDQTGRTVTDLEGNIEVVDRFEFEYNDEGEKLWKKSYKNDVLVEEITGYKTVETEDYTMRFPECIIEYREDGTKLVSIYGDNGEVETETLYEADGTVSYEQNYTYETDDE